MSTDWLCVKLEWNATVLSTGTVHILTLTPVPGESCVSQVSRVFPVTPVYPSYCRVSHFCRLVITLANIVDGGY